MTPDPIRPGSAKNNAENTGAPPVEAADASPTEHLADEELVEEEFVDEELTETEAEPVAEDLTNGTTPVDAEVLADALDGSGPEPDPIPVPAPAATSTTPGRRRPRGPFGRLYYGETHFDFVGRRRVWFAISAIVILAGIISLATRGLNLSIDFVGGTAWQATAPAGLTVSDVQNALPPSASGATVTFLGNQGHQTVNVEAKLSGGKNGPTEAQTDAVAEAIARVTGHQNLNDVSISTVGPSWGGEITHKAIIALIVFFILISLYISIFFEWRMALAAIIAVIHDIIVTVGIYSLTGFLVTPDTVVAFLTILGYSLYDTIVVFDRVRDNLKGIGSTGRFTISDVVNLSMNQTLARSLNTSLVAILPILSVLVLGANILGATTLQDFGLALLIGLLTGAYSSIFIASPLVAMMKEREPRWRAVRERLEVRGTARPVLSAAALASGEYDVSPQASARRARRSAATAAGAGGGALKPGSATSDGEAAPAAATNAPASASSNGQRQQPPSRSRPPSRNRRRGGRR